MKCINQFPLIPRQNREVPVLEVLAAEEVDCLADLESRPNHDEGGVPTGLDIARNAGEAGKLEGLAVVAKVVAKRVAVVDALGELGELHGSGQ